MMNRAIRHTLSSIAASAVAAVLLNAHPLSVSYSQFVVKGSRVRAVVRLPMDDVDLLMQLDKDLDNLVSAAEIEQSRAVIERYIAERLQLSANGMRLAATFGEMKSWNDRDGAPYLEVSLVFPASEAVSTVSIQLDVLTDLYPSHKNLAQVQLGDRSDEFVFENRGTYSGTVTEGGFWKTAKSFLWLGIEHIFTGYDHIMFLFGLLLVGNGFKNLVKIVTSFTIAHSLTLGLATLGVVQPVAWTIEAAIALSIAYVGFENLIVKDFRHRWVITFFFGLVHGFGFANILRAMHLPQSGLATTLFSFNLGVEIGQVAIVGLMFPLLQYAAGTRYRLLVIRIASVIIMTFGLVWFYQQVI